MKFIGLTSDWGDVRFSMGTIAEWGCQEDGRSYVVTIIGGRAYRVFVHESLEEIDRLMARAIETK